MPMCQAYGCSNKPSKSSEKSFFSIPHPQKEPARCRAWLHAISTDKYSIASYKYSKSRVVCEDHFEASCFERDLRAELGVYSRKKILKSDAVPTIFVHKNAPQSQSSRAARSLAHESSKMVQQLLNPPDYASGETSEGDIPANLDLVKSSHVPAFSETVEVTTQPLMPVESFSLTKRKRRRRSSNRRTFKPVSTQTEPSFTSVSCQTELICYDAEAQEPEVYTEPPDDHSYFKEAEEITEEEMDMTPPMIFVEPPSPQPPSQSKDDEKVTDAESSPMKNAPPSSSHEESHPSDISYEPETDEQTEEDEEERDATAEERCVLGRKFIVYEESLDRLLYSLYCGTCFSRVQDVEKMDRMGTFLRAKVFCTEGHEVMTWDSQPMVKGVSAGNLLVSAAILYSGNTFSKIASFAEFLGLNFIGKTTYFNTQREILNPVINRHFLTQQESLLEELKMAPAKLSGDGRCDSPGYNAKYCTYSLMDINTEKIVLSELVQVTEASSSVAMEKVGFVRCLDKLTANDVAIDLIATDRHVGIRAALKKDHPEIDHQFDVWHLAKSLKKKLLAKSKTKGCEDLAHWIQAVSNHLWWAAHTCGGDPELLVEKFTSVVYHICNIHSWDTCNKFHRCEHDPIEEDGETEPAWLEPDSPAHTALKDVVMDKRLLKDIRFLNRSCHTGSLEVFHGALLKYCPKRQEFDFPGMQARTQLAVIDHNANTGRSHAFVRKKGKGIAKRGQRRYNVVFSKASKKWVAKPIYEPKQYDFVYSLLMDTVGVKLGEIVAVQPRPRDLPSNIAKTPKPNKEELVAHLKSRFSKQ